VFLRNLAAGLQLTNGHTWKCALIAVLLLGFVEWIYLRHAMLIFPNLIETGMMMIVSKAIITFLNSNRVMKHADMRI
jgi:hypothetical protein